MSDNYATRGTGCPSAIHDWPLPNRLIAAREAADARLANGWSNVPCPDCQLQYGWIPSDSRPAETKPFHEPYQED